MFLVNLEIDGNGNGGYNSEVYEEERQEIKQKIIEIYNQLSDEQKDCLICEDRRPFIGSFKDRKFETRRQSEGSTLKTSAGTSKSQQSPARTEFGIALKKPPSS
jgi:hypothetical protein